MTNETESHANGVTETSEAAVASLAADSTESAASETADIPEPAAPAEPKPPSFDDLGLHPDVKQALDDMGYFAPTPVQTAVFKPVSEGKDLLVQSRTGTGKTTAFGLPAINKLVPTHRQPQVLILAPTRELALQVSRELTNIGKHRGIVVEPIYGGAPIGKQITNLQNGVHVVVGTPGRVLDHIGRRTLDTRAISTFILDECDEMLSMGFLEDIERVVSHLPEKKQTLLFSATMPDEVARYARRHMTAPEQISLSRDQMTVSDIHHAYYIVSGIARSRDLLKIIFAEEPESAIIFCNMRDETTMVAKFLQKQGLDAEPLSSDLSQADRERVMGRMKAKNLRFLCATDVAARGIDISNLSHVINYSVPESPEVYVHRTGRTGRAGKKGTALSMVGPRELGNFRFVRLTFGLKPEERLLPKDDIFTGKLKVPLPPVGTPQPPDPVQILVRGVQGTASELERQIFEKLLASQSGKRVLAKLVADKLDQLSTRTKPKRAPEARTEARDDAGGPPAVDGERGGFDRDRGDRPDRGERGERGGFDRDRGPRRFDRDARPEGGGGFDRGPRRFDRDARPEGGNGEDRPRRFDRDARPEGGNGEDRPRRFDRDARPEGGGEDRPRRFDRDARPEGGGEDRPRGDRPDRGDRGGRGDRERRPWRDRDDRGEQRTERPAEPRAERTDEVAAIGAPADVIGAPAAEPMAASAERTERSDRGDRGDRRDRGDRERRPWRDRNDRGDRGDRDRTERPVEARSEAEAAPAPAATVDGAIEVPPVDAPVHEEQRAERGDRGDRGDRRDRGDRGNRRDRDNRGGRDERPRDERPRDERAVRVEPRDTIVMSFDDAAEATEVGTEAAPVVETPAPTKLDEVARAAAERADKVDRKGKREKKEPTAETREFWETWAEEKTTRQDTAPAVETTASTEASGEADDRRGRGGRGEKRERGGRDRGGDKPARGGREREKTAERGDRGEKPAAAAAKAEPRAKRDAAPSAATGDAQARLFVSLGKKHGVSADDLRTLLAGPIGGDKERIGSVSLRDSHAHVRVPEDIAEAIIAGVHGTQHNEHDVTVERARA